MTTEDEESRREERKHFQTEATIQVMESSDADLVGLALETNIIDVSTFGLRLGCDRLLHECTLGIWIELADESDSFFLTTAIRWASWRQDEGCQIGLELIENPLSDQEKWTELWQRRLGGSPGEQA